MRLIFSIFDVWHVCVYVIFLLEFFRGYFICSWIKTYALLLMMLNCYRILFDKDDNESSALHTNANDDKNELDK